MIRVAIHSVPRSGSTWLGEIINSSKFVKYSFQPLFSYKFKDYLSDDTSLKNIIDFFQMLRECDDSFTNQKQERIEKILPSFEKAKNFSHIVYKEVRYHHILDNMLLKDNNLKLVLMIRNPIDVMNSWVNSPKEFNPSWSIENELMYGELKNLGKRENFYGLNAWVNTTKKFLNLSEKYYSQVKIVKYSRLCKDTLDTVSDLFSFLDLELAKSTIDFVHSSKNHYMPGDYSVFRGRKRKKNLLNKKIIARIMEYVESNGLSEYLYDSN